MTFTVEDGTGVPAANSYCSVQQADSYFSLSGGTQWLALTQEKKEQNLFLASQYIDLVWASVFKGEKLNPLQGLLYPRNLQCPSCDTESSFPIALVYACAEYAVRSSVSSLWPDPVVDETGRQPTLSKSKVGPIEEETRWSIPNGQMQIMSVRPYPVPDSLMWSFLGGAKTQGRVFR